MWLHKVNSLSVLCSLGFFGIEPSRSRAQLYAIQFVCFLFESNVTSGASGERSQPSQVGGSGDVDNMNNVNVGILSAAERKYKLRQMEASHRNPQSAG